MPPKIIEGAAAAAVATPPSTKADQFRGESLKKFLKEKEEEYLRQVLDATGGDKQRAAETLKISLATLYRKLPEQDEK